MKVEEIFLNDGEHIVIVWITKRRYVRITKEGVLIKKVRGKRRQ